MAAQSATVKVKVADPFPISACQNSAPYCIALSRPCPYRLLARSAMCTSAGEAPVLHSCGGPACCAPVGSERLLPVPFRPAPVLQRACCNGRTGNRVKGFVEALLRGGRAHPVSREYALNEVPILNHGHSAYQHKRNPLGILQRLFVRSSVNDCAGIKDRDVRVGAHANSPFFVECGRTFQRKRDRKSTRLNSSH